MSHVALARTASDLRRCYPVMKQLRPHLSEEQFVSQAQRQGAERGYQIAFVEAGDAVVAVAGFRADEQLANGKFIYVDDLVTDEGQRSRGHGDVLFDWLVAEARRLGCGALILDSGVQRFDAHRFYLRKRMRISSHHFVLSLRG